MFDYGRFLGVQKIDGLGWVRTFLSFGLRTKQMRRVRRGSKLGFGGGISGVGGGGVCRLRSAAGKHQPSLRPCNYRVSWHAEVVG